MHTYNKILRNTVETLAADAEINGKDTINITLDFDDVKIILDGLSRLEPVSMKAIQASDDTEHRSPYQATVDGMLSANYKERFKAEYQQLKIRTDKLNAFCNRIEAAQDGNRTVEEPKHDCSFELLRHQLHLMREYLHCLEIRAIIEGIDLNSI